MRSVNKVILVGNLTRDGEVSYTTGGTAVCYFTVATNRAWKGANGEEHDEASFHSVSAWGKFGENLAKILHKGQKVYVEGLLTYREKRDEAGKLVSKDARIRAESVILLDSRGGGNPGSAEEMESERGDSSMKGGSEFDLDAIAQGMDEAKGASKSAPTPISDDDLPF